MFISKEMLDFICKKETGKYFGYTPQEKDLKGYDLGDAHGHRTYAYGLLYHPKNSKYMDEVKSSYTKEELEGLYQESVSKRCDKVTSWMTSNNTQLNQHQFDAIVSACYNFGDGFLKKEICKKYIIPNPNDPQIIEIWKHLSDSQKAKYPGLVTRREAEAKWYAGNDQLTDSNFTATTNTYTSSSSSSGSSSTSGSTASYRDKANLSKLNLVKKKISNVKGLVLGIFYNNK